MTSRDLVDELRAIEEIARRAQTALQTGTAKNGANALKKIRERASDAARHAELNGMS